MPRLVLISDTHGSHPLSIPDGDILIHCGDATNRGALKEYISFNEWGLLLPHKVKLLTGGNHDFNIETGLIRGILTNWTVLVNETMIVEGLKIFGSPFSPAFMNWAHQLNSPGHAERMWRQIQEETDVIAVHGPPHGFGDQLLDGQRVGDKELFKRVMEVKPQLVLSGHIHCGYGIRTFDGITFVNASICDESYAPLNAPIVIDL